MQNVTYLRPTWGNIRICIKDYELKKGLDTYGYKSILGYYFDLIRKLKLEDSIRITNSSKNTKQEITQILDVISNTINQKIKNLNDKIEEEKIFHETLDNLNVSILFSKNENLFELKINQGNSLIKDWSNPENEYLQIIDSDFSFKKIFYSIAVNYSHHSLNSRLNGTWLDALFHKNDGYKTPLVINPMRDDGNFNINKEEGFARARLLANLISARLNKIDDRKLLLNEKQNIIGIHFWLKKSIREKALFSSDLLKEGMNLEVFLIRKFILDELNIEFNQLETIPYHKELLDYFVTKWYKILDTYDGYFRIPAPETTVENPYYVDLIYSYFIQDSSHITFKIRQVINYFKNELQRKDGKGWEIGEKGHLITPSDLIQFCGIDQSDDFNTIQEKLPPAIFEIDFILSDSILEKDFYMNHDKDSEWIKRQPRFGGLSSGEKQLIHSVQTVIYHLSNLESIDESDKNRIAYSHVNLIFDEIELYFHPDLQRKFIKYLIDSIGRVKLERISGINVIFATHSPFILSDITASNILRLENGLPSTKKFTETFGANIHEILANDFFMNEGFIGAFAKNYIIELIEEINDLPEVLSETKFKEYLQKVLVINEKFIQHKLIELLENKYDTKNNIHYLIKKKQKEIDELNKRKNDRDNSQ